jgi:hypothetical protein
MLREVNPSVGGRTECDGALRSLENTLPSPCTEPFPIEGLSISRCEKYGGSKLPMKMKIFMWQACQDRLQTGVTLKRKKWKGSMYCVVCGAPESGDHLFFLLWLG